MLIRTEAPADILPIEQLIKGVFPTDYEAKLVNRLRENGQRTLSLVACNDAGEVVGYLLFTPVTLEQRDFNWQGLAPLVVRKDYRGKGIAKNLVEEGLASLAELGYPACVVLGDPAYFSQFGFESAADYHMNAQCDVLVGEFQMKALNEGEFEGKSGSIFFSSEFSHIL